MSLINMITKEIICKELIKNGHSKDNGVKIWNIGDKSFRYINLEMAKAYLKLQEHPRYKATITEKEIKLLKENIVNFLEPMKESSFNLIDMGCINGIKAKTILTNLPSSMKIRYCPASVSEYLVKTSLENVKKENFHNVIEYAPRISPDFESLDQISAALRNNTYQKNVLLVLRSLIANFDINSYLFNISRSMFPDDLLIIGNGIRKGERFANLETYKHPVFNKWLIHLMRQLGFKDNEVEYNARFAHNRLEAYYKINVDKTLEQNAKKIELKRGDEIIVLYQYKFYAEELKSLAKMYFDEVELVKDPEEEYALVLCKR